MTRDVDVQKDQTAACNKDTCWVCKEPVVLSLCLGQALFENGDMQKDNNGSTDIGNTMDGTGNE